MFFYLWLMVIWLT